jgi:hypothetical protein
MAKKLTEQEAFEQYLGVIGNPMDVDLDKDETVRLFAELAKVDGIDDYLRDTMGEDLKRYWLAQDDLARAQVKGAYSRTMYFRGLLKKVREMQEIEVAKKKRTEVVA